MKLSRSLPPLAGLALTAALVACSPISAGYITEKVIEPEHRYTTCTMVGKVPVCTPHTDDQDWRFDIRDNDDKDGWVYVTPETYDSHQVGDWVDFSRD